MPLIKLAGLLIKSLSKPIASYVKGHLQDSPTFAKIMTGIGRSYQRIANVMGNTHNSHILTNDRAITLGSEIVVEGLFFGIGGGLMIYENQISKIKSAKMEERLKKIESKIHEIDFVIYH